ncbi:MAG: hydantoinase/oxoprolinase family protein [Candidatus Obscuribacterales bacterium]|nr:hydantoinase/oxoprolinase family protein [Candidatus Obscuribacterales bacterium]
MTHSVRIGIDVGGTFTHAVAIDAETLELLGKSKVATTHSAKEGVAKGIIDSLNLLLKKADLNPENVSFIAHSTTQATNALLEGDVAPVGVIAMGKGSSAFLARLHGNVGSIELAKGRFLKTYFEFMDTSGGLDKKRLEDCLKRLHEAGARAIAVSEAFSVDDETNEEKALQLAREKGFVATAGSEVSKLYGLKVRTRTAVINAAMLPKMIETADMTESSVRAAGIKAPIMIMRSDGGVMDIDAMRKRPILTRLSGPAAGVAAAMMYLRISDAIFLEVGGTSTDISVIRNGKALVTDAEIGGHRVYLRSLDVNTLGVAGGSMLQVSGSHIKDVGPRSAHIAGMSYVSFVDNFQNPQVELLSPKEGDPADYVSIKSSGGVSTLTPTCASNLLSLVPEGDCASGNKEQIRAAFQALAAKIGSSPELLAEEVLDRAYEKILPALKKFAAEYKLDMDSVTLVGGGGGAAAIVPYVAKKMGLQHALAENADVVSAIGVALALVRETVERQVVSPKQEDLIKIREEAFNAVAAMGADPSCIEVHVEVDPRANILRATAYGATGLTEAQNQNSAGSPEERLKLASDSFRSKDSKVEILAETEHFTVFGCEQIERKLFGLIPARLQSVRAMDRKGVIRLKMKDARLQKVPCSGVEKAIADLSEENAQYGDAGKIIPDFMIISGPKIIDLSGLQDTWQVQTLARSELTMLPGDSPTVVLAAIP